MKTLTLVLALTLLVGCGDDDTNSNNTTNNSSQNNSSQNNSDNNEFGQSWDLTLDGDQYQGTSVTRTESVGADASLLRIAVASTDGTASFAIEDAKIGDTGSYTAVNVTIGMVDPARNCGQTADAAPSAATVVLTKNSEYELAGTVTLDALPCTSGEPIAVGSGTFGFKRPAPDQ